MADDMNAKGSIELEVVSNLRRAISELEEFISTEEKVPIATREIAKAAREAVDGMNGVGKAARANKKDIADQAKGFAELEERLSKFNKEQRQTAQKGVVAGGTDGKNVSGMSNLSTAALKEYIAIDDARGQNATSVARQIVAGREKEAAEAVKATATQDRVYNDYLARQDAGVQREVASSLAAYEKIRAARVAAYTSATSAASGLDASQAADRDAKRYATVPKASRNTATSAGLAASNSAYSSSALSQMKAFYQAEEAGAAAAARSADNLISKRYALYDIGTTYAAVGTALTAVGVLSTKTAADFESSFSGVQRTTDLTGDELEELRQGLIDLSTTTPLSFDQITQIAQLGNQLGIASQDIESFTGTIARFSAVSGLSVETVATAFGKLGNLLDVAPEDFEKFGSAMAKVAVEGTATEATIISLATEIAATASGAGLSATAVVGLSGALSSLGVAPEKSRGSLELFFGTLNKAVAEGGDGLENFARITGMTGAELDGLVRSGQGEQVLRSFIVGLSDLDNVAKTTALDDLNLSQLRVTDTFKRLSQNLDVYDSQQAAASQGFADGSELADQYAKIVEDLNSQFQILVNSVNALIAELSGGSVSGLAALVGLLAEIVNKAREFASVPLVQYLATAIILLTTITGVVFIFAGANAVATASTYALMTAQTELAATGAIGGIRGLVGALFGYTGATAGATVGTRVLTGAVQGLKVATLIGIPLAILTALITDFGGTMAYAADVAYNTLQPYAFLAQAYLDIQGAAFQAARAVGTVISVIGASLGPLGGFLNSIGAIVSATAAAGQKGTQTLKAATAIGFAKVGGDLRNYAKDMRASSAATSSAVPDFKNLQGALDGIGTSAPAAAEGIGDTGSAAGAAQKEVRTLVDYANDLRGVFDRTYQIQFGGDQALDAISTGWFKIKNATAEANQQIAEYQASIAELSADRSIQAYWLTVAENYGDTLRAGELRASIGKIDADLTKKSADLSKAQDKNSKTLVGNSEGAIENRESILGLVKGYQDLLVEYAASGASQAELAAKAVELKAKFVEQATALGYSRTEIDKYAGAFDQLSIAISKVPRNITVTASTSAAQQAMNEYSASIDRARENAGRGIAAPAVGSAQFNDDGIQKQARAIAILGQIQRLNQAMAVSPGVNNIGEINRLNAALQSGNYWTGGYVGDGGKFEPKGIVHGGEFVFSKEATRNIGVGNLAYAHKMAESGQGFSSGGAAGVATSNASGTGIMELGAFDRRLLMDIRDNIGMTIAPTPFTAAVNATNVNNARRRNA